jgi:hypothetical protein
LVTGPPQSAMAPRSVRPHETAVAIWTLATRGHWRAGPNCEWMSRWSQTPHWVVSVRRLGHQTRRAIHGSLQHSPVALGSPHPACATGTIRRCEGTPKEKLVDGFPGESRGPWARLDKHTTQAQAITGKTPRKPSARNGMEWNQPESKPKAGASPDGLRGDMMGDFDLTGRNGSGFPSNLPGVMLPSSDADGDSAVGDWNTQTCPSLRRGHTHTTNPNAPIH